MTDKEFETLSAEGIRKLRVKGALVGVKAPTTLSKEELLKEIRAVMEHEKEPYFPHSRSGRPAKNKINIQADSVIKNSNEQVAMIDSKVLMNDVSVFSIFDTYEAEEPSMISGFYRPSDARYGFIDCISGATIKSVAIAVATVNEFRIKPGDCVKIEYYYNEILNHNLVNKIYSVNEISNTSIEIHTKRRDFNTYKSLYPIRKMHLKNKYRKEICFGTRNIIKINYGDRYSVLKKHIEILDSIRDFDKKYYFVMEESPELLSVIDENAITFPKTKSYLDNVHELKLMLNNVKRNVEMNKHILLFISSLRAIEEFLTQNFVAHDLSAENSKMQMQSFIKNLLNLSRDFGNAGSLTIFVCDDIGSDTYDVLASNIITANDFQ